MKERKKAEGKERGRRDKRETKGEREGGVIPVCSPGLSLSLSLQLRNTNETWNSCHEFTDGS